MGKLLIGSFASYELTEQEQRQGSIFTALQKQVLQNNLARYAEERLALEYDPEHPTLFLQQEAEIKAQIQLLQFLLISSEIAEEELRTTN